MTAQSGEVILANVGPGWKLFVLVALLSMAGLSVAALFGAGMSAWLGAAMFFSAGELMLENACSTGRYGSDPRVTRRLMWRTYKPLLAEAITHPFTTSVLVTDADYRRVIVRRG
jgi:hypothetical protein